MNETWTITVCPECGEHRPYSALDAMHGLPAICDCWGLAKDENGYMTVRGPLLIALEVKPVHADWRAKTQ